MKLKVVGVEGGRLEMQLSGEDHTLLNLLQSSLLADEDVRMAGYTKPHPLMDRSVLYVSMKGGKDHIEALLRSAEDAKRKIEEFLGKFGEEVSKKAG